MTAESEKLLAEINAEADAIKAKAASLAAMVSADPAPTPPEPMPVPPPSGVVIIVAEPGKLQQALDAMPAGKPAICELKHGVNYPDAYVTYRGHGGASVNEEHIIHTALGGPRARLLGELHVGVGDHEIKHLAIEGIDCPVIGPSIKVWGEDIAVRSIDVIGAKRGLVVEAESASKPLRSVYLYDAIIPGLTGTAAGMAHGLYVWGVDGLEVEGFVFDKAASATDMFDHFAYIQASNRNVSARNCAFLRGADNQLRAGGYYRDCLFIGMDIGAVIGCGTADENVPGGATIDMKRCAWLGGRKALHLGNIKSGIIEGNLFADGTGEMAHVQAGFAGVQNLTWRNNVRRKWAQGITFAAGMPGPGCSFTQTQERTDLYGVDLSLGSFGFPDLFAALRNRQIAPVDVTTMARQRCGMA